MRINEVSPQSCEERKAVHPRFFNGVILPFPNWVG
jgi:hypothetical protein